MKEIKCIKFPKIGQFRNVIKDLSHQIAFEGLDEEGNAIYNNQKVKPTLTFYGSVKLHGTNAGVAYNKNLGMWTQSRNNAFTLDQADSHFGFTFFVNRNKEIFQEFFDKIAKEHNVPDHKAIVIYGEWAGKGVQKKVAISEIEKSFFIFGIKIYSPNPEEKSIWVEHEGFSSNDNRIYNILDFPTFKIDIDFNSPKFAQNALGEFTDEVEKECPVSKQLGVSGIGEGVVWTTIYEGNKHTFKVKGEEHNGAKDNNKKKKVPEISPEKMNSIQDFVNYAVTQGRFNQGLHEVFVVNNEEPDVKGTGKLLSWIVKDIMAEEMDVMNENNLEPKDVNKYISNKARKMFFEYLDNNL
jgi:hypothetical protein